MSASRYSGRQMLKDILSDCIAFGYPGYKASKIIPLSSGGHEARLTYETGDVYLVTVHKLKPPDGRRPAGTAFALESYLKESR